MGLVNRLPERATLLDLTRELECAARLHAPAPRSASRWLIGQACREEWHRLTRERAVSLKRDWREPTRMSSGRW